MRLVIDIAIAMIRPPSYFTSKDEISVAGKPERRWHVKYEAAHWWMNQNNLEQNQNLEQTVIRICKDSVIEVNPLDIESCHRLLFGRNAINTT